MSISIRSNTSSLHILGQLNKHTAELSRVSERLSSGLRINHASDDASSLALADDLRVGSKVFAQGLRNFNDGISLLNIADSTLEQLGNVVGRIHELAEQAANGTLGSTQRKALNSEAQALSKEFTRITQSTTFNGIHLLSGEVASLRLQGGYGLDGGINSGIGGAIGDGTFGTQTTVASEAAVTGAHEFADLNGDGILDLVTSGINGSNLIATNVRLGLGGGSFGSATEFASAVVGNGIKNQLLTDLNNDGNLDLVVLGGINGSSSRSVTRLGIGNGTFGSETVLVNSANSSQGIAAGDVNGDGKPDLVTSSAGAGTTLRLGNGNGTFGTASSISGALLGGVNLSDFNGDGTLDLATAGTSTGVGTLAIQLGNGDGTFGTATSYSTAGTSAGGGSPITSDFNADGSLDIVTINGGGGVSSVSVLLGNGSGTFQSAASYVGPATSTFSVSVGDANGDGIQDLAVGGVNGGSGEAQIRLGNGNGSFGNASSYSNGTGYLAITLEDANEDGVADLISSGIVSGAGGVDIRLANAVDGVAPILPFSLNTIAEARQALSLSKKKQQSLSAHRGEVGAFLSRVASGINTIQASHDNYISTESQIRSADLAFETSQLVSIQIRQQATVGILAQANQQPSIALKLLSIDPSPR